MDRSPSEETPELEPGDARLPPELDQDAGPEADFARFEDPREAKGERLRGLPAEAGDRKARHRHAGEITPR